MKTFDEYIEESGEWGYKTVCGITAIEKMLNDHAKEIESLKEEIKQLKSNK